MHSKYYIPARSAEAPYTVDVTPESAGWTESSLQVVELETMQEITLDTGDTEVMILPLAGVGTIDCDNEAFELSRRVSVFDGPAPIRKASRRSPTAISRGQFGAISSSRSSTAWQCRFGRVDST